MIIIIVSAHIEFNCLSIEIVSSVDKEKNALSFSPPSNPTGQRCQYINKSAHKENQNKTSVSFANSFTAAARPSHHFARPRLVEPNNCRAADGRASANDDDSCESQTGENIHKHKLNH